MQKSKVGIKKSSNMQAVMLGLCVAVFMQVALLSISAICIHNEYYSQGSFMYIRPLIQFVCVFIGSLVAGCFSVNNMERSILLAGAVFLVLQMCFALLFFDGILTSFWISFVITALAVGSGIILKRRGKFTGMSSTKRRRR